PEALDQSVPDQDSEYSHRQFTDRFCATGKRKPTGTRFFDTVCDQHGIERRLITPRHPQTNGRITPMQPLKNWQKEHSKLFAERVSNQPGLDKKRRIRTNPSGST
ncbi:MAG: hypothetical protein ACU843_16160, partial [Gammaproteobacteria bacterium]